jgi:hypothetical protein
LSLAIELREGGSVKSLLITVCVVGACKFTPPSATTDGAIGDDASISNDTIDGSMIAVVPCATPDSTNLVLCLEFEDRLDDGVSSDSSPGHHDATASGLATVTRNVPTMSTAAHVGTQSTTRVAEVPALELAGGYTFGVWVNPDKLPVDGSVFGVLDHEEQYAMVIGHSPVDGSIQNRCVHTGFADYEWTDNLPTSTWSYLACTWDGHEMCAYRWTSPTDHLRYCHVPPMPPHPTGANGLAIGHLSDNGTAQFHFEGALDSLQIYSRGLTEAQVCAVIGQAPGCTPCDAGSCL